MSRFRFSLESLRRYQIQVRRIAEIHAMSAKAELERAKQNQQRLLGKFNETSIAIRECLVRNSPLLLSNRDSSKQLAVEIEQADVAVQQATLVWRQTQAALQEATTKLESFEQLRERERDMYQMQSSRAEASKLLDTIMRRHQQSGEVSSD